LQVPVLQAGGFTFVPGTPAPSFNPVTAGPTIPDEANANQPNILGSLSMANTGAPNSGSDEFFFNLADNTNVLSTAPSTGFAVFGQVASGADQRVLNTLAAIPITDESAFNINFQGLPLKNYTGSPFPNGVTAANLALINSVTVVQQPEKLTFSIVSNSDTTGSIVTATIKQGQLDLHPVGTGTATIVVRATDTAGVTADFTITAKVL
jgi:cyclophilin family peptidyl-prolyl cis-trans isomerase